MAEKSESRLYLGMKEKDSSRERGRDRLAMDRLLQLILLRGKTYNLVVRTVIKEPRVCALCFCSPLSDIRQTPAEASAERQDRKHHTVFMVVFRTSAVS
jgi:hypothetical protein